MRMIVLAVTAVLCGCAHQHAASPGSNPSAKPVPTSTTVGVEVVFSEDEIRIIRAYYETHGLTHGKGKHKNKGLPPGIAKKLARGKPLPPGIAKRYLPDDLQRKLPPPPEGYERFVVAGKVLLIELATQIVRDVLTEAVLG